MRQYLATAQTLMAVEREREREREVSLLNAEFALQAMYVSYYQENAVLYMWKQQHTTCGKEKNIALFKLLKIALFVLQLKKEHKNWTKKVICTLSSRQVKYQGPVLCSFCA